MTDDDVDGAVRVQVEAFGDLARREGETPHPITDSVLVRSRARHRHLLKHDPDGAYVAVEGDTAVGCALALRRNDLWGLSLLVVDPATQSAGVGRRLLGAALGYAAGCDRAVILSSGDPRAMRAYATSGFALHPQVHATGAPDRGAIPALPRVRVGGVDDIEFADRVDVAVRGAAHGPDHELMMSQLTSYVVDDTAGQGYAYVRDDGHVYLLAASDDDTATALLWQCIRDVADLDLPVTIEHLNDGQQWAFEVAYRARLTVQPAGPVFWRGGTPPRAYLASGAYL